MARASKGFELTSMLLLSSFVCALAGAVATLLNPSEGSAWDRVSGYFPVGPWRILVLASGATLALAILFSILRLLVSLITRSDSQLLAFESAGGVDSTLAQVRSQVGKVMERREPDISRALDLLLHGAMQLHASDIHFNPLVDSMNITYRVDGVLHMVLNSPGASASRLTSRIKVLARLDSFGTRPQDGGLRRTVDGVNIEARVSSLPANHGDRVVLRLVRASENIPSIYDLGFDESVRLKMEAILQRPDGLFFVSGPVGSGKTTTLYSALQYLHDCRSETTSLVTLEDPIERQLGFATQTQINPQTGMTFAQTLRSVLRQDPGALMLGEIRDQETAEIATQASLTGHLILTTLHVQSAAGTFARLVDMKVEPFVISSCCAGSLAQRLVRQLCDRCKEGRTASKEEHCRFEALGIELGDTEYFVPSGCEACDSRGYNGRLPVAELLVMSDDIRAAVQSRKSSSEIHRIALAEGMVSLLQSGLDLARKGKTSLSEVLRVAG